MISIAILNNSHGSSKTQPSMIYSNSLQIIRSPNKILSISQKPSSLKMMLLISSTLNSSNLQNKISSRSSTRNNNRNRKKSRPTSEPNKPMILAIWRLISSAKQKWSSKIGLLEIQSQRSKSKLVSMIICSNKTSYVESIMNVIRQNHQISRLLKITKCLIIQAEAHCY